MAEHHDITTPPRRHFQCARCGACCRWEGFVRVDDQEIAAIAQYLGLSDDEFIRHHTRLAPDRRGLALNDAADGACAFFDAQSGCRINPVKPQQCRDFPTTWSVPPALMERCQGRWIEE